MDIKRIGVNIFSNWTFFALVILTSFFISPILVHKLGDEQYGLWTLIGSIVGYFSVMDFGINTALVRFISKYDASKEYSESRKIYSNACLFFVSTAVVIVLSCLVIAHFFPSFVEIKTIPEKYVYIVFILAGLELATMMGTGMFSGVMHAKQEFLWLNIINIIILVIKNTILVVMLLSGFRLMTVAIIHLSAGACRSFLRYLFVRKNHKHLVFRKKDYDFKIFKTIFGYSIYSFMIAVSLKVLFFTDSIVIGTFLSVSAVTYYAIPMTLMTYLEQIVTVGVSVLTPVISSNDATGDHEENKGIYIWVSRYSLALSLPVVFVLFTNGDSFISLWMGDIYGAESSALLKILCLGYLAYLSQLIATELLKGISRHKFVAYVFIGEAIINLAISVVLIKYFGFGLIGAAFGTMVPLLVVNLFLIPVYTCRLLKIGYIKYMIENYFPLYLFTAAVGAIYYLFLPFKPATYFQLFTYSSIILLVFMTFSFFCVLAPNHRRKLIRVISSRF